LDGNNLREIPQAALPAGGIQILRVENCSLSNIPVVVKTMTAMTELSLAHNNFSQNPDFARLPKTLKKLNLENCQLNNLSAGLEHLSSLATLCVLFRNGNCP
jgi:Leucine-rich repeat (LRR) protein